MNLLVAVSLLSGVTLSRACTTFVVGKGASADGSVMATHTNDGGGDTDPRLVKVPARDFAPGDLRPIWGSPEDYPRYVGTERQVPQYYVENCEGGKNCKESVPLGYIPQVNHTYAYFEATYGVMNEMQVGIAESTCSGVFAAISVERGGHALLSIDQLSQIAMERAASSKEAVQLMGDLATEYGFYGESASFEGGSESLLVIDPNEAWVFHILADPLGVSAIWVAARVPDDSVSVVTNMFSVREVDLSDTANFLGTSNMWEIALRHGYWKLGDPMDFTATFSDGEYAHKYYSGRRAWGVFRLLAPSANLPAEYGNLKYDAPYPFAVPVDSPVTPQDMMAVMRDWYNGTAFTTGSTGDAEGRASQAFGITDRYGNNVDDFAVEGNWERTISLYRSSDTFVVQARGWLPNEVGGVLWFGPAAAHATTYVPLMISMDNTPDCLSWSYQGVYNTSTSYWAHRNTLTLAQIKFDYMIEDIRELQNSAESRSQELVNDISAKYVANEITQADVSTLLQENAFLVLDETKVLHENLLFKYADGNINFWTRGDGFQYFSLGYPVWWLEDSGYENGPPPVDISAMVQGEYVASFRAKAIMKQEAARKLYELDGMLPPPSNRLAKHTQQATTAEKQIAGEGAADDSLRSCIVHKCGGTDISGAMSSSSAEAFRTCTNMCLNKKK